MWFKFLKFCDDIFNGSGVIFVGDDVGNFVVVRRLVGFSGFKREDEDIVDIGVDISNVNVLGVIVEFFWIWERLHEGLFVVLGGEEVFLHNKY